MATQKEMIAEILQKQKDQGRLLTEMDAALRGPEYDPEDGGLLSEVRKNTKCIANIKKRQHKIITWGVTVFGAINVIGVIIATIVHFRGR